MGWSCARDAAFTMDKWTEFCIKSTGSSNTFEVNGESYFIENSRTEHDDGAITGAIWKNLPGNMCKRSGTFRINGDGSIARAPKVLKEAAKR